MYTLFLRIYVLVKLLIGCFGQQILSHNVATRLGSCTLPNVAVAKENLLITTLVYTFRVNLTAPWTYSINITNMWMLHYNYAMTRNIDCHGMILVNDLDDSQMYPVVCSRDGTYMYFYANQMAKLAHSQKLMDAQFSSAQGETTSKDHKLPLIVEPDGEHLLVNGYQADPYHQWLEFRSDKTFNLTYCVFSDTSYMQIGFNGTLQTSLSRCTGAVFQPTIASVGMGIFIRAQENSGPCRRSVVRRYILVVSAEEGEDSEFYEE